jgi:hypothetical protein
MMIYKVDSPKPGYGPPATLLLYSTRLGTIVATVIRDQLLTRDRAASR